MEPEDVPQTKPSPLNDLLIPETIAYWLTPEGVSKVYIYSRCEVHQACGIWIHGWAEPIEVPFYDLYPAR